MLNYLLQLELKINYDQFCRLWIAITVKTKGVIQKREFIRILYTGSLETSISLSPRFFPDNPSHSRFFTDILCNST